MILTNKHGLPEPLVRAILNDPYEGGGDISVTRLISPPRIVQLRKRHYDEIEVDVTERLFALMGQAVHTVLERAEDMAAPEILEARAEKKIGGWTVSGKPDLWTAPGILDDYKVTSVYSIIYGRKENGGVRPEWAAQMNCNAHLYRHAGLPVEQLRIIPFYRDFSKTKAKQGGDYPQVGAEVVSVPVWPDDDCLAYMINRVGAHKPATLLEDDELPECTPEERWAKPNTWAVMKKGNKRATRVFEDEGVANTYLSDMAAKLGKGAYVKFRPGASTRCEDYCEVAPHCNQWAAIKAENPQQGAQEPAQKPKSASKGKGKGKGSKPKGQGEGLPLGDKAK